MASMYAVYHGPEGLWRSPAACTRSRACCSSACGGSASTPERGRSSTRCACARRRRRAARSSSARSRRASTCGAYEDGSVGVALDETVLPQDVAELLEAFAGAPVGFTPEQLAAELEPAVPEAHARRSAFLTHPVFNSLPLRDRDAALPEPAAGARPLARAVDDPARLVHDEAQRHRRDAPGDVAGARAAAPVRAGGPGPRLPRAVRRARALARRDHRLRRRVAAAERGRAGRVRGAAGDPRLPPLARRHGPQRLPDPGLGARHEPRERGDGGLQGRAGRLRRARQHRPRRPARARRAAPGHARRADGDLPVDARRVRGGDPRHLPRSSTSTAARSTWTART